MSDIETIDSHLTELDDRHHVPFLKLTSSGKRPELVRAAIEHITDGTPEDELCDKYDIPARGLLETAIEVTSFTDVDDDLDEYADTDLYQSIMELEYEDRRRLAEVSNTDAINGRSPAFQIARWYANHYNEEVIGVLSDVLDGDEVEG